MSAQSGIQPTQELLDTWASTLSRDDLRLLTVVIQDERLVAGSSVPKAGSAEEDYGQLEQLADASTPAFYLFRLDEAGWLLVVYVPDTAPVRSKMLYASTRASLTRSLGESHFVDSLHAHATSDLTSAAYRAHVRHSSSSAPLTERERELADLKAAEGVEARGTTPRGGAFSTGDQAKGFLPWNEEAQQAARELGESNDGSVHLVLDVPNETVVVASKQTGSSLAIPADSPSYTLVSYNGTFAMVYCCPDSSPVKSRLLYSASARGVAARAGEYGVAVVKRLETSDPAEVTTEWLAGELGSGDNDSTSSAPPPTTNAGFARPKRPGGRGGR